MTAVVSPCRRRHEELPDPDDDWWAREFDALVAQLEPPPGEAPPPASTVTATPGPQAGRPGRPGRGARRGEGRFPPTRVPGHQRSPPR